ncbi:hypothetical protein KI387_024154, partial [Taxus chinensis]
AERDKVLAKVERKSEVIEALRSSIKAWLKELYPHITRRMDTLKDLGKEMEKIVDTLGTQGIGLSFDEVSILVGDLCQKAQSKVDIWNKLE